MRPGTWAKSSRCSFSSICSSSWTKRLVVGCCGCRNTSATGPCSTICPASITATRSQTRRITSISWVISTMVSFSSRLISASNCRTEAVVCGSSALVASSQSRIFGLVDKARAIPTRCFWPPDNCAGYFFACSDRPTRASSSLTRMSISLRDSSPARVSGSATLSATVLDASRLKCWKIIPTCWRKRRRSLASNAVTSSPSTMILPPLGASRRFIRRSRVLLPAPEWPISPNTWPFSTLRLVGCSAGMSLPATR
ncbi:hypothetical protein D9M71_551270 [compost metagenome]